MGAAGTLVVSIVSFLAILFIFTGENGLVFCFCHDGVIWESGTMVEASAAEPAVGAGADLE